MHSIDIQVIFRVISLKMCSSFYSSTLPFSLEKSSLFDHLSKSLNIQNKHTVHWQQAVLQSYLPCSELFHAIFENSHSHLYYIYFSKFYFLRKLLIFMHSYFGLQTVPLTNELTRRPSILHLLARIHSMISWPHRDLATGYLGDRSVMCFCRSVLMMSV